MASLHLTNPDVANAAGDSIITVADILSFLRRNALLILVFLFAGSLAAVFYATSADPVYTARAQILIDPKLPQHLQQQEVATSLDTAQVESQIAMMRSEKIAAMVINHLDLQANPTFFRIEKLSLLDRVDRFVGAILKAAGLDEADRPAFFAQISASAGHQVDDAAAELTDFERDRYAIDLFQAGLDIRRVGVSYAVDIYFRSHDSELAAKIANATADMFIREQMETKAATDRAGGEWLERRMGEMRSRMNQATQVAQEFRAKHDYRVQLSGPTPVAGPPGAEQTRGTTLEELEVTADTYRQMYESFLIAYTNNVSNQSYPVADARVITAATMPLSASHPRKKLILAFGMLSGVVSGVGIAFLRHLLDRTLRSPRQIGEELGLRCLGELPAQPGRNDGFGSLDAVVATPFTWFSESLRRAKATLNSGSTPLRCIGVTSALPHEGKEIVACNLALLYARAGLRTVLVDADVEEQLLTRAFSGGSNAAQVSSRSGRRSALPNEIIRNAFAEVDLLPVGSCEPLRGSGLPDLTEYEMVVVNLSPLEAGADRLRLAAALDGSLLVAEWGKTPVELVRELTNALQAHNAPVLGLLLTKVKSLSTRPYTRDEHARARIGSVRHLVPSPFRR